MVERKNVPATLSESGKRERHFHCGGIQWPFPETESIDLTRRERGLFENARFFTADGRAIFKFADPEIDPEAPNDVFPLRLLTGRGSSAQ